MIPPVLILISPQFNPHDKRRYSDLDRMHVSIKLCVLIFILLSNNFSCELSSQNHNASKTQRTLTPYADST
jgi:hypothetical protein